MKRNLSLNSLAAFMIIMVITVYTLQTASGIILPLLFGLFLSLLLHPIRNWYLGAVKNETVAILFALVSVFVPFLLIGVFFTSLLTDIISSLPSINKSLLKGLQEAIALINQYVPLKTTDLNELVTTHLEQIVSTPLQFLQTSLRSSTSILFGGALTTLYAIFFLYYYRSFKNFFLYQIVPAKRQSMRKILSSIRELSQQYIIGLALVVIILSVLNSIGLWIIGVDYPLFWGVLAGMLAIIPYFGTTLGGLLPFLYALATCGTVWQPVAVAIFYFTVQQIEGNFITPNVVGDKVDINPLVSIMGIIIFNALWGLAGIILALPVLGMIRIFLEQIDATKPLAILLSSDIYSEKDIFENVYDDDKYRFFSLFKNKTVRPEKKEK